MTRIAGHGGSSALVLASPSASSRSNGWIVTEVGRQPWVVSGLMRTRDAVTSAPGVVGTFYGFVVLYTALGAALVYFLRRLAKKGHARGA